MILETEQLVPHAKPLVTVKGHRDGLVFLLDEQAPCADIITYLESFLSGAGASLFAGTSVAVSVDYGSREWGHGEVATVLALFLSRENFILREWGSRTQARQSIFANRQPQSTQTIYKGTVRAGQQLLFDGDVVIIGDVNPGGEVIATKDIYVFGRLRGTAHAGVHGETRAIIAATEFAPMQLRIGDVISRAPEADGRALKTQMEFAYLREDAMAVDKMQFLPFRRNQHSE